jgi:hypothetical protein
MLKAIKAVVAVSVLLGAMVPGPAAAVTRKFSIYNSNGKVSVQRVWYARAGESGDPWHEVMLDYAVKPGASSPFTMADGDVCLYDVKVQFSDEYVQQHDNVNVCRGDTVTVT